jgi:hypothetical protein
MGRIALKYSAGLIALYLGVAYATGGGKLITALTDGGSNLVTAFQARNRA